MKNSFYIFLFCLLSITVVKGQAPSATLSVICNGNSNDIDYIINMTNYTGNVTLSIEYDPAKVDWGGLNNPMSGVTVSNSATTLPNGNYKRDVTISITTAIPNFPIRLGFPRHCPQECFGQNISTTILGTLSGVGIAPQTQSCTKTFAVNNEWGGESKYYANNYDCKKNQVTMFLTLGGNSCHLLKNGKITLSPSMGNVVYFGGSPVNTPSTSFPINTIGPNDYRVIYYTIQLPCNAKFPDTLKVGAVLGGDNNCGTSVFQNNIYTYPTVAYPIPQHTGSWGNIYSGPVTIIPGTNPVQYAENVTVTNYGALPLNTTVNTSFPNKKIISINYTPPAIPHNTTMGMNLFSCGLLPSVIASYSNSSTFPQSVSLNTKRSVAQIQNLQSGKAITITYKFIDSTACSDTVSDFSFNNCISYLGFKDSSTAPYCNCDTASGTGCYTSNYYPPSPIIQCGSPNWLAQSAVSCPKEGDVGTYCTAIKNNGGDTLRNPVIKIPVSNLVTLNTISYNGTNIPFTLDASGLNYVFSPSSPIIPDQNVSICYNITFKANIPEGPHYIFGISISGNTSYSRAVGCEVGFTVCIEGGLAVVKKVYDYDSEDFQLNGSGQAGVPTKYRFILYNKSNRPITNFTIVDRMPHINDKQYTNCDPRNSQYNISLTNVINPATNTMEYFYDAMVGRISLPPNFSVIAPNSVSCTANATSIHNTLASNDNTVIIKYPYVLGAFGSDSFDITVNVPSSAVKGEIACNTATYTFHYMNADGTTQNGGTNQANENGPPVCYTILPPPCNTCPGLLGSSKFVVNPATTSGTNDSFMTKVGIVTVTTLKPVQEIHISLADLQYSWDKEGCTNCKTPAIARGCLFPATTTQTIGTGGANGQLNWDNFTGNTIPPAANNADCTEELIWKLGVMLQPGTYNIPVKLTLPKSVIPSCCNLKDLKFDVKVSLKDAQCNVCDTIIQPSTLTCCSGGSWISKSISTPPINTHVFDAMIDSAPSAASKTATLTLEQQQVKSALLYNKFVATAAAAEKQTVFGAPTNVECGGEYHLKEGSTRVFGFSYACNTTLGHCGAVTNVSIQTVSGAAININQTGPVTQTFSAPGVYNVTYKAKCGTTACDSCTFKVVIDKDCCLNSGWNNAIPFYNINNANGPATALQPLPYPPVPGFPYATPLINTKWAVTLANLNFKCSTTNGCGGGYTITRKNTRTNSITYDTVVSPQTSTSIYPPSGDTILVTIQPTCGGTNCGQFLRVKATCSGPNCVKYIAPNSISVSPVTDGLLNGKKEMLSSSELDALLKPMVSVGAIFQSARVQQMESGANLVAIYSNKRTNTLETITIPLVHNNGYLNTTEKVTILAKTASGATTEKTNAATAVCCVRVGHVTLLK